MQQLGLQPGAVTALGVLNNEKADVTVVVDRDVTAQQRLGVHPGENTATLFLRYEDLARVIRAHGNPLVVVDIP